MSSRAASEALSWLRTRALRRRSLSPQVGLPAYSIRRVILLTVCMAGVLQYGLLLVWGVIRHDIVDYFKLSRREGTSLYDWSMVGSCGLSFIPGLVYDRLGPPLTMVIATICGILPLLGAWMLGMHHNDSPRSSDIYYGLCVCQLFFGLSTWFFGLIGNIAPLVAFEGKHE